MVWVKGGGKRGHKAPKWVSKTLRITLLPYPHGAHGTKIVDFQKVQTIRVMWMQKLSEKSGRFRSYGRTTDFPNFHRRDLPQELVEVRSARMTPSHGLFLTILGSMEVS